MMIFGVTHDGITAEEMERRGYKLRPALANAMRAPMRLLRKHLVAAAGARYKRKTGRTVENLRKGKVSAKVEGHLATGKLTHRAMFLNILEPGATIPAMAIRPVRGQALRFFGADGQPHFSKLIKLPARTIPARPITRPALDSILPMARAKLHDAVVKVIAEGRFEESDAAE
jgi:hypothetical protein